MTAECKEPVASVDKAGYIIPSNVDMYKRFGNSHNAPYNCTIP